MAWITSKQPSEQEAVATHRVTRGLVRELIDCARPETIGKT